MRTGIYARVSTQRQAQADGLAQQIDRLQAHALQQGWSVAPEHIFRDDGYSGAKLTRPGLERLRDRAALRELDRVLITAPDRLARNYVHQVLLLEEITATGCEVEFLDRPMSQDPHDQLLLQIRGAVAEYERTLITERMRRAGCASCRPASFCRGSGCRTAIASIRIAPAIPPACGRTKPRPRWWPRCSPGMLMRAAACMPWPRSCIRTR